MRTASFERDFWQLRSGEECHHENPDTFWIPPLKQRQSLKRGDAAKLLFEIEYEADGSVEVQGERMWVVVAEQVGDSYVGILGNQPACLEPADNVYLRLGAEISFKAEHVIDIARPPDEYIERQLGQPPERVWPRTGR